MNGEKFPREFEHVTKDGSVQRLRIPGGWYVRSRQLHISGDKGITCSESTDLIMDKEGVPFWNLEEK